MIAPLKIRNFLIPLGFMPFRVETWDEGIDSCFTP